MLEKFKTGFLQRFTYNNLGIGKQRKAKKQLLSTTSSKYFEKLRSQGRNMYIQLF
jgi:hypothetical protein